MRLLAHYKILEKSRTFFPKWKLSINVGLKGEG